jgi:lysophospholipase L1-like esterase
MPIKLKFLLANLTRGKESKLMSVTRRFLIFAFVLLIAELSIRALGLIGNSYYTTGTSLQKSDSSLLARPSRLLVIGGSITLGAGAPKGQSYSDFLQKKLEGYQPGDFAVFNAGISNANTRYVLESLDENLNRYKPTVVVAMLGLLNLTNYYGYDKYLLEKNQPVSVWLKLYSVLRYSSLFRLVFQESLKLYQGSGSEVAHQDDQNNLAYKWIAVLERGTFKNKNLRPEQIKEARQSLEAIFESSHDRKSIAIFLTVLSLAEADAKSALHWIDTAVKTEPEEYRYRLTKLRDFIRDRSQELEQKFGDRWIKEATDKLTKIPSPKVNEKLLKDWFEKELYPYQGTGTEDKNTAFFERAISSDPLNINTYFRLIQILTYKKKYQEAIYWEQQAFKQNPYSPKIPAVVIQDPLENEFAETQKAVLQEYLRIHPQQKSLVDKPETAKILEWVESDIKLFAEKVRAHGADLVLQTYPPAKFRSTAEEINTVIRRVAAEKNIPVSDTYEELSHLIDKGGVEEFYLNTGRFDHHLNGRGYSSMADILFSSLQKNNLIR